MADNPLDKMSIVVERLNEVAAELGLKVETAAFIPGPEGGPHYMQAMMALDPEIAFKSVEEREEAAKTKDEFDKMMRETKVDQDRETVEGIKSSGFDLLKSISDMAPGQGIGLDAPEPPKDEDDEDGGVALAERPEPEAPPEEPMPDRPAQAGDLCQTCQGPKEQRGAIVICPKCDLGEG